MTSPVISTDSTDKAFMLPERLRGIGKSPIRELFDRAPPGSINLGLGEPDLPTPEVIKHAAVRAITEEQNGYTAHAGLLALRQLIAHDYPHLNLTPDEVVVTAGSQEALYLTLLTLVDRGDEVLLPDPGFVAYKTIVRMAGGVAKFYRLPANNNFGFDADEFRKQVSERTKVVICTSPSNPTGRTLSADELELTSDALRGTGAYIVTDEIYRELYYTPERPASVSEFYPRTIIISGLSKSMSMTGWRIGWLCGNREVVRPALVLHGYVTTCASTVSQKAALAAWTPEAIEARAKSRATLHERRDSLVRLLINELSLPAVTPDGAFYVMVDVSRYCNDGGDSLRVAEAILKHKVITVPGSAFGREARNYLRLSFCADTETLAEGIRRIGEALTRIRSDA